MKQIVHERRVVVVLDDAEIIRALGDTACRLAGGFPEGISREVELYALNMGGYNARVTMVQELGEGK